MQLIVSAVTFVLRNRLDVTECSPRVPLYGKLCWDANKGLH